MDAVHSLIFDTTNLGDTEIASFFDTPSSKNACRNKKNQIIKKTY
jgi:hypothetical protein